MLDYPNISLYFWREPTLTFTGYLPGTRAYVIHSPGIAPRATYKKPLLFRFSVAMQQKIAFS